MTETAAKKSQKADVVALATEMGIEFDSKWPIGAIEALIKAEGAKMKAFAEAEKAKASAKPIKKAKADKKGFNAPVVARAIKSTASDNAGIDSQILRAIVTGTEIGTIEKQKAWVRARMLHAVSMLWSIGAFNPDFDKHVSDFFNQ